MEIQDKVAIVIAGANGIGKTIAEYFHKKGAFVYIVDIDAENRKIVSKEIKDKACFFECDITNDKNRRDLISKIFGDNSTIDILINNAGGEPYNPKGI